MDFVFKRTNELSSEELDGIVNLFERVFEKKRPKEIHINQFVNNPLGYSYHSIIEDDGKVVGVNTYVPVYFKFLGKNLLFANSIDSMVDKEYRDFFAYKDMVDTAYRGMKKEGVAFVYGYPNDNAMPVVIKSKLMKRVGRMRIYCLPVRVGGVKKGLSILNPLSAAFANAFAMVTGMLASSKADTYPIQKEAVSYNKTRYLRGDGNYGCVTLKCGAIMHYKIKEHEGVRTAFIMDMSVKSPKAFTQGVNWLLKRHGKEFDLLLYPGNLGFKVTGMIRIPRRFEPKNFNLAGKILDKSAVGDELFDIRNWDTNLSNYDLL